MTQPNFRKMLTVLACWAKAAKDYLEYQQGNGKPPPSPDEVRAEILRSRGIKVPPSPTPFFDLLAKWKKTGKASPINLVFDNSSDPFYQLFCVAQKVLEFPASQWPAYPDSKAINDLLALLRPIEKGGGRSASIADLKRIAELVKSTLAGIDKPPTKKGRKGKLTFDMFVEFQKDYPDWHKWSSRALAELLGVSHTSVLQHKGWKAMRALAQRERPTDMVDEKDDEDEE